MSFTPLGLMEFYPRDIDSWEKMSSAVRRFGFMPFFRCGVPGWSVQDMTAPGFWFDENGEDGVLGPWDWKVDVVREGDIAYGKFLGGKAAFATVEWYAHLMNWRRSLPKYGMAERRRYKAVTKSEKLMKELSPVALAAIRESGSLGSRELREVCSGVRKNVMESVMQYLQMGTWTVVGDIQRVYNGPNLTYKGWQISSHTTPEDLFGNPVEDDSLPQPSWLRHIEESSTSPLVVNCTPEESRQILIEHVMELFPEADPKFVSKML